MPVDLPLSWSLKSDCTHCFALCCNAFGFSSSSDFAIDKPAGAPCPNLGPGHACRIHRSLRPRGFRGCAVFDCFGAGQAVSQRLFGGIEPDRPEDRRTMFDAFTIVRQLHEMLWHLEEAEARTFDPDAARAAQDLAALVATTSRGHLDDLRSTDMSALHSRVAAALREISEEVRAGYRADGCELFPEARAGADLAGRDLRSSNLCAADLRGACLIGADLRGNTAAGVDLLGADLRDARIEGADLSTALFVTQPQIESARGNADTALPHRLSAPAHWSNRPADEETPWDHGCTPP